MGEVRLAELIAVSNQLELSRSIYVPVVRNTVCTL